ncbi:MAG: heavy metal translocating P-type ATPase [Pseudonocardiaceae bacterium]
MLLLLAAVGATAMMRWGSSNRGRVKVIYTEAQEAREEVDEVGAELRPTLLGGLANRSERSMVERIDPPDRSRQSQQSGISGGVDSSMVISRDERKLNRSIAAAAISMGTAVVGLAYPILFPVTVASAIYGTMRIFKDGYYSLVHERKFSMDVMGSVYFVCAFADGFFLAGSFGLLAYYLSEKLILITQDRSQQSLINIFGQQPRTVWQRVDDVDVEVPLESVQAGDTLVIQAGQVIPVDGVITDGIATIDQHVLTGESQPVEKGEGDLVLTSTLMMAGRIFVRVEKTGQETTAAQIGVMLNKTASYQASLASKGEQVADKSVLPTITLALVALPVAGYPYMVTVLGSAIGLNIKLTAPVAMLNFLNVAANNGILVKDGRSLELLKDVDTVVFDKTGTLTLDEPNIAHIHTCTDLEADGVLRYAAMAEHRQTHPIARAILAESAQRGLSLPAVDRAQYEIGYGLSVRYEDQLIRVGSERYMALEDIALPTGISELAQAVQDQGHSLVMVAVNDRLVGAIELKPTLRAEIEAVVDELRRRNLDICIISGDQEDPTKKMADALGISRYFANVLPEEKASLVAGLQSEGRSVCFVGDGINDSISLKKANVSVSMRGASTVATDAAQIVLMGEGLQQLPFVFQLADEFDSNMRAGFGVAVGQGIVVIGGALLSVVGIVGGTLIWSAALLTGLGIAYLPLGRHQIRGDKNGHTAHCAIRRPNPCPVVET